MGSRTCLEYQDMLNQLRDISIDDPIRKCGEDIVAKIVSDPDSALKLADEKIHIFPFKDVDACWRRLYTDAGISRAIKILLSSNKPPDWLTQIIKQLDMVLIMTGALLREELIDQIFFKLQDDDDLEDTGWTDSFSTETLRVPELKNPIPASTMTVSQFQKHLVRPCPRVIKQLIRDWPALSTRPWRSPEYLKHRTFGGRRIVPIELGRSYTDEDWSQRIMSFSEFLEHFISKADGGLGYLAQHDLFHQIPALRNDIYIPDFCYTSPPPPDSSSQSHNKPVAELDEPLLNAWFGPAGTISPLHHDPYHNILCQVVGKKYVRLYAPSQTTKLYPRRVENGIDMSNTSSVPVELVEMSLGPDDDFPSFDEAEYVETILEPGDSLYIPLGWWHYVRSLSISFSVSFWWN